MTALGVLSVLLCSIPSQPSKFLGQYTFRVSMVWFVFLAVTWNEKKDLALLCSQPHFTLISIADPPPPPPRIRFWIYAYMVFVCVFLTLQIFIKTASMLELTMLHIQEQACIPHQSVIPKEQCQLISHCCSKTHGWKQLTGEKVCFGLHFGI